MIGVMQQVLAMTYLWLKAGHVIFVIFWMAGLFMLPRYFVYHQEAAPGSPEAGAVVFTARASCSRSSCGPRWWWSGFWVWHWP